MEGCCSQGHASLLQGRGCPGGEWREGVFWNGVGGTGPWAEGGGRSVRQEGESAAGQVDGPAGSSSAPCRALARGRAKPGPTCKLSRTLQRPTRRHCDGAPAYTRGPQAPEAALAEGGHVIGWKTQDSSHGLSSPKAWAVATVHPGHCQGSRSRSSAPDTTHSHTISAKTSELGPEVAESSGELTGGRWGRRVVPQSQNLQL